jgi:beta-glucosidase
MPRVHELTLAEQVGQLFVVRVSGFMTDAERLYPQWELSQAAIDQALNDFHIGGILLYGGAVEITPLKIQQLQKKSKIPLFVCADLEEGAGQHFRGATALPPAMALARAGEAACYLGGLLTAQEARAMGLNWVLAPVADVNVNPLNPVINVRAFGDHTEGVTTASLAFWRGLQAGGVFGCAKHFPGHGDVTRDSHLELPRVDCSRAELEQEHWPPFQALIAAGIETVMAAHVQVPALDCDIASLSKALLTGHLREVWDFQGLIITDALTMQGITNHYDPGEAAVAAVEAGADIILMPEDLATAYEAVMQAVLCGRITQEHLLYSVEKILALKKKIPPATELATLNWSLHREQAQQLFAQSLYVPHLSSLPLPLPEDASAWCNVCITAMDSVQLETLETVLQLHPERCILSPTASEEDFTALLNRDYLLMVVHLFLTTGPYRSLTHLAAPIANFLAQAYQQSRLIIVSYGNPYLLQNLPPKKDIMYAYTPCPEAQAAVTRLLRNGKSD